MSQGMKYEVPTEMRDFAEKSVEQARKALDGFLTAAHKVVDTVEGSTSSMQSSTSDMTKKTLSYAEQNIQAAFDHASKLVRARDLQEAYQLQTEYARTQFAAFQGQLKEFGEMTQSAARTATERAASVANEAAASARAVAERTTSAMQQGAQQAASNVKTAMES